MAPPATEAELTRSATTIDSLPVEILEKVLLRVPTPAALVHAAAASRSWRGAIATPEFLHRYRKRHKSSPFLGLYVPCQLAGPPSFHMPNSIRLADAAARDLDLKDAAVRAFDFGEIRRYQDHRLHDAVDDDAFILGLLAVHPDCRLLDCHNSRLLLTRSDEALEVRSPLARESILLPFPPYVVHPDWLEACLLQGHDEAAAASFRVVFLQHRREGRNRQARAVEYDSSRKSWQDHPWYTLKGNIEGTPEEMMHAGHRIFCTYTGQMSAALLLDTSNMQFSVLHLPSYRNFYIGEIEDNACCFVESDGCADHRLRVWQLDEEKLDWDLKKDVKMDQVIGEHVGYYRPRAISNGITLLCSPYTHHHHFVVDLNTCNMKEKFEFLGQSAYPMQMPWPPAFSGPTANAMNPGSSEGGNNENQHELRDGAADGPWLSNEPQCLDIPSNEPQYLDIQDPSTTASTPAAAEQCFGKDKNYVPNDYVIPDDVQIATSCCREASAASTAAVSAGECKLLLGGSGSTFKFTDVGKQPIIDVSITSAPSLSDPGAGESAEQSSEVAQDSNAPQDLDIQDPRATAPTSSTAEQCFGKDKNYVPNDYLIPDLCGQISDLVHPKGRKRAGSSESKGSPVAMGPGRNNWKRKPKYLEAIFALRTRHSFSIASKISDELQIATSSYREAYAASTAAVSCGECKLLLGGSGSTFKFTDVGKQPIIDVSITSALSLSDPSAGESAEQRGEAAQDSNESQDLDIQDPTATAPTPSTAEQCFGKDKNYVPNDYLSPDMCGQL